MNCDESPRDNETNLLQGRKKERSQRDSMGNWMDILAVFHLAEPMGSMDCKDDSYYYEEGLGM